jgi:hypothetical protein
MSDDSSKLDALVRMLDGPQLEVRGCDLWTFRGDQVVRKDSYRKIVEP